MSSTMEPTTLAELDDSYAIIGELAGREDARTYVGVRRSDDASVHIAVTQAPRDDEGNALSLLAADTNLLATLRHRNLLPIIEGRWIGAETFAVISERINAPTLAELLEREKLTFPRIAAILQEVSGLLEWARGQKIVHRAVAPETLLIEPGSDRLLASFAISPIPFGRTSPIGVDARTIGNLAQAMLARHEDLAVHVVEQTDALLKLSHNSETVPNIPSYIASIAMAEALKLGEIEYDRSRHAIEEQQRVAAEQLEAERGKHEHEVGEQKNAFDKTREDFERELAKERKELAKEREALAQERAAHQQDREALGQERAAHDRNRDVLAKERADHKRDREHFESHAAALEGRARLYEPTMELPIPVAQELPDAEGDAGEPVTVAEPAQRAPVKQSEQKNREGSAWWNIGLVAGALVVIVGASMLAIGSGKGSRAGGGTRQSSLAAVQRTPAAPVRVVDSVAGGVAPSFFSSVVPLPSSVPDSVMVAAAQADSALMRQIRRERAARRAAALARQDSLARAAFAPQPVPPRPDSAASASPGQDSVIRRDTMPRPRNDSVPKRDTTAKVDSVVRRDTTALR